MSLEAAVAENTAALKEVAVLLREANEGRTAAVEALKGAGAAAPAASATGTARRGRPPGSGAKDNEGPKDEGKPAAAAEAGPIDIDTFRTKAGEFLSVTDEKVKAKRKEFIRSINDHLSIEKVVQAEEGDRAKILDWLTKFANGETVNFSEGEDEQPAPEEDDGIG